MAKKKRHKSRKRQQTAPGSRPARQQPQAVNRMQRNLELINRIQPKVAAALEERKAETWKE